MTEPQAEAALEVLREILACSSYDPYGKKPWAKASLGKWRHFNIPAELWDRARTLASAPQTAKGWCINCGVTHEGPHPLASASDAAKQHPLQPVSDLTAAELDGEQDRKLLPLEPTAAMLAAVGSYSKDQLAAAATYRLMVAAVSSDEPKPSAAQGMADEYQAWIDFFHAGSGDYNDFLRVRLGKESGK
jgi:hypothetical protein